ncbi:MAG: phosphotransferase [Verrucomicrobia bacterium]|nr:phosphotransferase [Verrucomicrobiota bacterium]
MTESMQLMLDRLIADGLVTHSAVTLKALTGGVSSEIFLVTDGASRLVVKQALGKLMVKDDWFADTSRNESEYDYIQYVYQIVPQCVPRVLHKGNGYFAMEYLGDGFENWKEQLLGKVWEAEYAKTAGCVLAKIHDASRGDAVAAKRFNNDQNFWDLRIEPYIVTTGKRHPELSSLFEEEAKRLRNHKECLVHGDFSPKNILVSESRLVALDCEVANFGDPVFDYCFLLNHLLLKALFHGSEGGGLRPLVESFMDGYGSVIKMSPRESEAFSIRGSRLLAMLLLARVDGKSPVEYLTEEPQKEFVRRFVYRTLHSKTMRLEDLIEDWFAEIS